jgi:hypothetical protein
MPTQSRLAEVQLADAFLAQPKTLDGAPPIWGTGSWGGEHSTSWVVLDAAGVPKGSLRFTARKSDPSIASINLIWRNRPLWRVDVESPTSRHNNPPDAWVFGLSAAVTGTHAHSWLANRGHILAQDQQWDLPYRVQMPDAIRRLGQALLWLGDEIQLTIDPDQRGFEGPTKADLFS